MEEFSIDKLLKQCRSGNPSRQVKAIQALRNQHAYSSVSVIIELLSSPDEVVRSTAAEALAYLGKHEVEIAGAALVKILTDPEVIVRSSAVDAIGILAYTPAVEIVKSLLGSDPDPLVRASAAETLGDLQDDRALPDLERAMHDNDITVRAFAASSIGLLANSRWIPRLQTYLEAEHSSNVKAELLGALYRLGAIDFLEPLLELLKTADEDLATLILNLMTDFIERKRPPTLSADATRIRNSLAFIAQRFPILRPHVEQILIIL